MQLLASAFIRLFYILVLLHVHHWGVIVDCGNRTDAHPKMLLCYHGRALWHVMYGDNHINCFVMVHYRNMVLFQGKVIMNHFVIISVYHLYQVLCRHTRMDV